MACDNLPRQLMDPIDQIASFIAGTRGRIAPAIQDRDLAESIVMSGLVVPAAAVNDLADQLHREGIGQEGLGMAYAAASLRALTRQEAPRD